MTLSGVGGESILDEALRSVRAARAVMEKHRNNVYATYDRMRAEVAAMPQGTAEAKALALLAELKGVLKHMDADIADVKTNEDKLVSELAKKSNVPRDHAWEVTAQEYDDCFFYCPRCHRKMNSRRGRLRRRPKTASARTLPRAGSPAMIADTEADALLSAAAAATADEVVRRRDLRGKWLGCLAIIVDCTHSTRNYSNRVHSVVKDLHFDDRDHDGSVELEYIDIHGLPIGRTPILIRDIGPIEHPEWLHARELYNERAAREAEIVAKWAKRWNDHVAAVAECHGLTVEKVLAVRKDLEAFRRYDR